MCVGKMRGLLLTFVHLYFYHIVLQEKFYYTNVQEKHSEVSKQFCIRHYSHKTFKSFRCALSIKYLSIDFYMLPNTIMMTFAQVEYLTICPQRRVTGDVDFYRNYSQYVSGFGDLKTEFWLGLENLHRLCNEVSSVHVISRYVMCGINVFMSNIILQCLVILYMNNSILS